MWKSISRWLRPKHDRDSAVAQLEQMRSDLDLDSTSFPADDLRPVLIPSPILEAGDWVGPYHHFPDLPLSLTWVFLRPQHTMRYLSTKAAAAFDAKGVNWRATARLALVKEFENHPWTHEFRSETGDVEAVGLLHADGLGPSRLIMCRALARHFGEGFLFFAPERYSAFVLSANASAKVRDNVGRAVHQYFSGADVPMSESGYSHALLREALERADEYT